VQEAPPHLLVELGQFPGDGDPTPAAQHGRQVGQRGRDPVGRLVEDERPLLVDQLGQALAAGPGLAGQEALEHEAGRWQAGGHQGGHGRRRTGHHFDPEPVPGGGPHQALPRVTDARHTGVGHHRHPLAPGQAGQDLLHPLGLVVVVDHQQLPGPDAGVLEEAAGAAAVLAGHDVGLGQLLHGPGRQVPEVADGGADQHEGGDGHAFTSSRSPGRSSQCAKAPPSASITQRALRHGRPIR